MQTKKDPSFKIGVGNYYVEGFSSVFSFIEWHVLEKTRLGQGGGWKFGVGCK